ncbi:tyrosine-type recombinase/integrase [Limnobacter humi]|uniref:Tyrosine-type recombinase/integrase n=1 Tax=Limnobacter humi TaxID=1778671 RepID=A0ABT1WH81_9BURK|nr:tyrosine-type recombinase/integrase [Limnobacter humi]MCQ8896391.1 tyrosine-type recombinase/integrase [Limnobacter humi]
MVNRKLEEIEGMHIADFRDALAGSGYAPAAAKRYMEVIKAVFKIAKYEWGFRKILDPTEDIRMPSIQNARSRRLSQEEFQSLLASCDEHPSYWLRPYVVLAVETAMRRGELGNLKWLMSISINDGLAWIQRRMAGVVLCPCPRKHLSSLNSSKVYRSGNAFSPCRLTRSRVRSARL